MTLSLAPTRTERILRQRLLRAFQLAFPAPPKRIIVGFSGGPDSLALAWLLKGIERAIPSTIELLHVDHRIRADSSLDVATCKRMADEVELPFVAFHATGHPRDLYPGVGLEEGARRVRFSAFAMDVSQDDVVALAHHAGDQTETVLLHLMHGAGLQGVSGMANLTTLSVPWWDRDEAPSTILLWRPLLGDQKSDLEHIVAHHNIAPLHDATNSQLDLKRNAIRHVALPALRSIEPTIDARLGSFARIASDEDALLERLAEALRKEIAQPCGGLAADSLVSAPAALSRRVVRRWLERSMSLMPTLDRVEAVRALAKRGDLDVRLEIGDQWLVGLFGNVLRCGTETELEHQAWLDARLILPLVTLPHEVRVTGDLVRIAGAPANGPAHAARRLPVDGVLTVRPLTRNETMPDRQSSWSEWMRTANISPWIRANVQGIAVNGSIWWIPRRGDCDDSTDGRLIRLVWSDQEQA